MFFWRSNDGLRRLFQPGLDNTEMGETSPGSCTHKEGDVGIVWGEPKGECGGVIWAWSVEPERRNGELTGLGTYGGYHEQN